MNCVIIGNNLRIFLCLKGILLLNLGSPEALTVPAVREYLNEFLMDGQVIDVLTFSPVVGLSILLRRPAVKVEEYSSVWTDEVLL